MSLNMFKHMESLIRIFCEAELRFKMKMSFYLITDNLFVQKLVFSHPKETIKALWSVLPCSCVYNNSPRGFRPMIPAAWNVDSTERVAVCPSATDVRPFTHTIGKQIRSRSLVVIYLLKYTYVYWPTGLSKPINRPLLPIPL